MQLDEKEKELLRKLREAGKRESSFTLTLKVNDEVLEEMIFSAENFSKEALASTRVHFVMNDIKRMIVKAYSEVEAELQEEKKQEQINKMWEEQNKQNNNGK